MCSWCWAFRPVWEEILRNLPEGLATRRLLGGLAPDTEQPMPQEMQQQISGYWHQIQQRVPGTRFNFAFWKECSPRRATYPACRAVIAATRQDSRFEELMILAIQQAYYLQARNPSEPDTLGELADEIGLNGERFRAEQDSTTVQLALEQEIRQGLRVGARGFPSLVLEQDGAYQVLIYSYTDPEVVLRQLRT
jgi:putative protein-disulfide isomerase